MPDRCTNCGELLRGPYCSRCGQQQKDIRRFFLALFNEAFEDLLSPDGRTARTLVSLFFRPGHLTAEYSDGRRASYLPPLRVYLVTSFLFFLFLSLSNAIEGPMRFENELGTGIAAPGGGPSITVTPTAPTQAPTQEPPPGAGTAPTNTPGAAEDDLELEFDKAAVDLDISLLSESGNERAREVVRSQGRKVARLAKEDPDALVKSLIDLIPPIMFLLLPLFAALLKLTYLGSGRYYSEHLILALHTHSFIFLVLLVSRIVELCENVPLIGPAANWTAIAIDIWIPLYLYLTLRNYFGESTGVTLAKVLLLLLLYLVLFVSVLPFAMLWGFFTL